MSKGVDIVVAEDEENIGFIVKSQLQHSGFSVVWEKDGEKALEAIQREVPRAVVLDLMMPIMSGFDVLKALKKDPATKEIPVIILSARTQEMDIKRAILLGAEDYLIKPFLPSDLVIRIEQLLEKTQPKNNGESPAETN